MLHQIGGLIIGLCGSSKSIISMKNSILLPIFQVIFLMLLVHCCRKNSIDQQLYHNNIDSSSLFYGQVLAGTDELGRTLPMNSEVGNPRPGRYVGIFYFLWQGINPLTSGKYWDLSKIIPQHPEVLNDFHSSYWGTGGAYYWGEPIWGYYKGDDEWVHLKNMQLLENAGVDFVVIDATNGFTYPQAANALMNAMDKIREQGGSPPKIVFYTNTASGKTMEKIYHEFYMPGAPYRHPDCWFYLEGKPLIIGHITESIGMDYQNFFTIRESQWPNEPMKTDGWPWIDFHRPQQVYYNHYGEKEIISVSVAQHPNLSMGNAAFYGDKGAWGRSFHNGSPGNPPITTPYGYNIQEEWNYAIQQNVPFVFVTGWNEWIAIRLPSNDGDPHHSLFVDEASPEFSRDIEPTLTANLKDNYYMQLISNIRKYKGLLPIPSPSPEKTISSFSDWTDVGPIYKDYVGDIMHRHHESALSDPVIFYQNNTGRNDFDIMKVARDNSYVYFYVKTQNDIIYSDNDNWMVLYINADRKYNTGWYGYDYRIIHGDNLQKYDNSVWVSIYSLKYFMDHDQMMIKLPRKYIPEFMHNLNFEFKWTDNIQDEHNPLDFYINGDVAPDGRLNFLFKE